MYNCNPLAKSWSYISYQSLPTLMVPHLFSYYRSIFKVESCAQKEENFYPNYREKTVQWSDHFPPGRTFAAKEKEKKKYVHKNSRSKNEVSRVSFRRIQVYRTIPNRLTRSTLKNSGDGLNSFHFCHPANETSQRIIMLLDLIKRIATIVENPHTVIEILYKLANGIFFFLFFFLVFVFPSPLCWSIVIVGGEKKNKGRIVCVVSLIRRSLLYVELKKSELFFVHVRVSAAHVCRSKWKETNAGIENYKVI